MAGKTGAEIIQGWPEESREATQMHDIVTGAKSVQEARDYYGMEVLDPAAHDCSASGIAATARHCRPTG
jgi:hypothetical protein